MYIYWVKMEEWVNISFAILLLTQIGVGKDNLLICSKVNTESFPYIFPPAFPDVNILHKHRTIINY